MFWTPAFVGVTTQEAFYEIIIILLSYFTNGSFPQLYNYIALNGIFFIVYFLTIGKLGFIIRTIILAGNRFFC